MIHFQGTMLHAPRQLRIGEQYDPDGQFPQNTRHLSITEKNAVQL